MASLSFLAFAGSARRESYNRKLLALAAAAVRAEGAAVTIIELGDLALPLYHGDLEEQSGIPAAAQQLVAQAMAATGYLIATPEYNSSITPLLKNTIDWMSRSDSDPFAGKIAAVCSASPGQFGAMRSALLVRQILSHIGTIVVPAQCTVSHAHEAFDADGQLKDPRTRKAVAGLAKALVTTAGKLAG